ncbi:TPA: pertactin-like passenger domain-containing protein, partial [Salmonella enterica subsp. diarizonae serovar 61:r:-]
HLKPNGKFHFMNLKLVKLISIVLYYPAEIFAASIYVKPGETVNNTDLNNGDTQYVIGGTATNTSVGAGAYQYVTDGFATGTIIKAYGKQFVNGGSATGTIIKGSGHQGVIDGGSATGTIIEDTGSQGVNGGSATGTIIKGSGAQYVHLGPVTGTIFEGSGVQIVYGGHVTDTIFKGYGTQIVHGGHVTDTIVSTRSNQEVHGGSVSNTTVTHGGGLYLYNGTVNNVKVSGQDSHFHVMPIEADNKPVITGDITISDKGQIVLSYGADSSGADMTVSNDASLQLNNAAACTTNCLYTLNSLALSGGSVALYNTPPGASTGWNTLNLSSLSGNGDFYMHTEVASGKGDLLNITGNATGSFRLFVQ